MGAMLIFVSIVISKWGYRFGVPTLLLMMVKRGNSFYCSQRAVGVVKVVMPLDFCLKL